MNIKKLVTTLTNNLKISNAQTRDTSYQKSTETTLLPGMERWPFWIPPLGNICVETISLLPRSCCVDEHDFHWCGILSNLCVRKLWRATFHGQKICLCDKTPYSTHSSCLCASCFFIQHLCAQHCSLTQKIYFLILLNIYHVWKECQIFWRIIVCDVKWVFAVNYC